MDENAVGQVIVEPAVVTIPSAGAPPETQTESKPVTPAEPNIGKPPENAPSEMEKKFADGFFNARNPVQAEAAPKAAPAQSAETAAKEAAEQASTAETAATSAATAKAADAATQPVQAGHAAEVTHAPEAAQASQQPQPDAGTTLEPSRPRDWVAEWKELADAHPEVVGKPMPDDIYKACLTSEQTPLRVYESMMLTKLSSEIDALKAENATLRQNAESGARAPVTPSTGGANPAAEDAFLRGFNLRYGH